MNAPRPAAPARQPWPMKWVVLAILACIIPYTWINLHYRKPGKAFEPYADMKERANTARLADAGFQRISLDATLPSEPGASAAPRAEVTRVPGGVPTPLSQTLVELPLIPAAFEQISAPAEISALLPVVVELVCVVPNNQEQLLDAFAYVREGRITILVGLERIDADLLARSRENLVRLTLPAGSVPAGRYEVELVGAQQSARWSLVVH